MPDYPDSIPESITAEYYFSTDPTRLSPQELDKLWMRYWQPLGEFPNQLSVARLIRHFTKGRFFVNINQEFVLLSNGEIYYGGVAVHLVYDLVLEWIKAFITQNQRDEDKHLRLKFTDLVMRQLSSHSTRETITSLLRTIISSEAAAEAGKVFTKSDLPCLVRNTTGSRIWLGKFSLFSGKIEKITNVGLFPVLSGLEFREDFELQPQKTFEESNFKRYLTNLVGNNEENLAFMGRLMGVLCEEGNDLQIWVWLQGPAGNGKTVFIDIIATILGELATKGDNDAYNGDSREQRFARAAMENRRLAYFSELPKWFKLHDGKLKGDTEGTIRIENKHKDSKEVTNTCKPIFISNHSVHISDDTEATRGRLILLETSGVNWRKAEGRVQRYHETLWNEENEIILQFLVDSYRDMKENGLRVPKCYQGDTEESRTKTTYLSDRHQEYLTERVVRKEGSDLSAQEIENDYRYWSLTVGYGEVDKREMDGLFKALTRLYGKAQKSNGKMKRRGLGLVSEVEVEKEIREVVDIMNKGN